MDWNVVSKSIPLYWDAMLLTLKIGWIGVALATLIGLVSAVVIHFRIPVLSVIFKIYIEIFRNTPLLIQLFFLYFALPKIGIKTSAEVCGWLGLGLLGGSYMSEAFRSGIEAIDSVQRERAELGNDRFSGDDSRYIATGFIVQHTCFRGKYNLFAKGKPACLAQSA